MNAEVQRCPYCEPGDERCPGYGLCHCGCGETTNLARQSRPMRGGVKRVGQPNKFVLNHQDWGKPRNQRQPPMTEAEIEALLRGER